MINTSSSLIKNTIEEKQISETKLSRKSSPTLVNQKKIESKEINKKEVKQPNKVETKEEDNCTIY